MSSPLSTLRRLGNQQLLRDLKDLVRRDRHVEADLLAHIAEVDSRKLFREEGYSSLFRYLVEELRFSEDAAYSRIQAARAARDYPVILDRTREGELHRTGVKLLAPHLTEANHLELLDRAKCKTRQRIEELVANLAPRPDAPALVRKLQERNTQAEAQTSSPVPAVPRPVTAALESPAPSEGATVTMARAVRPSARHLEPLGQERYRVQFTADRAFVEALREVQALLRHQVPDGDLAVIFGRALGLLRKDVKRKKFGKTERPSSGTRPVREKSRSRHIPNAIRREVAEREAESCSYRGRNGKVCGSKDFLEYEHEDPWAKHGEHRSKRIRLRCREHNLLAAEREFGREHMDRFTLREARDDELSRPSARSGPAKTGLGTSNKAQHLPEGPAPTGERTGSARGSERP